MNHLFHRSMENKEKIIIFYIDRNNNITQRVIRVISIEDGYIVAFCYWRKKVRSFTMDNILSAGSVKKKRIGA